MRKILLIILFTVFAFTDTSVDYFNRGFSYSKSGDDSRAISDYTEAIRLNPKYVDAYSNRGVSYDNLGRYLLSTKDARKACTLGNCKLLEKMGKDGLIRD